MCRTKDKLPEDLASLLFGVRLSLFAVFQFENRTALAKLHDCGRSGSEVTFMEQGENASIPTAADRE